MNAITKLLCLLLFAVLQGCSSAPAYRQASGDGFGYQDQQLADNYHRVQFKLRSRDQQRAFDYAIRRAAELSNAKGFDWFEIVNQHTLLDQQPTQIVSIGAMRTEPQWVSCGLLSCSRQVSTPYPPLAEQRLPTPTSHTEVRIDFRMGKGVSPQLAQVFRVAEVLAQSIPPTP